MVHEKYSEREAKIRLRQLTGLNSQDGFAGTEKANVLEKTPYKGFYSSGAVRARSILAPEIAAYVDRSFTQRGMKENVVGRKKKNYPKRSKIIKVDKKTGQPIYPPGHSRIIRIDKRKTKFY